MNYYRAFSNIKVNNSSSESKLNILTLIQMAIALIVIAWMNNGIFTYATPYVPNYIRWGLFMVWFGLALTSNKKFTLIFIAHCWPLLILCFYILIISLFTVKNPDVYNVYIKSILYLIMVYSVFLYYIDGKYLRYQKVLVTFLSLDCVFLAINTYIQLQLNPLLARFLATGTETIELRLGTSVVYGVGSYGYFYALVSIILLLGFLLLNYSKRKLLVLLLIFLFVTLLIQSAYTIAIIFTFIFLVLLVHLRYTNKYTFVATVLLGVMTILIFQDMLVSVLIQIAHIKGISYVISDRLIELAHFFSGYNIIDSDLYARGILYSQSLDAFTNNMLMGTSVTFSNKYGSGGHSAWLDLLAQFGVFSIPFFVFLNKSYKYCKNRVPENFRMFVNVYWLYFICLGFINTILFANIYTIWFLFLPMIISSFFGISEKI